MANLLRSVALVSYWFCSIAGSNILGIFNYPSKSHHLLGEALMKGLVERGHNVTMISPFPASKTVPNYTHIEINEVREYKEENLQVVFQGNLPFWEMLRMMPKFQQLTPTFLESRGLQTLLRSNSTFDVAIVMVGLLGLGDVSLAIAHHFKTPVIGFAPVGGLTVVDNFMGNPNPYSYVPNALSPFNDDMTFTERVLNTLYGLSSTLGQYFELGVQNKHLAKYFPDSPTLEELAENISLVLVNSHVSTETPRPYLPNMVQIGGFHIQEPETLPEDLQRFLDASENGVVYFSFGTNIKTSRLSPEMLDAFVETFGKLPLEVLWNYDGVLQTPSNVRLEKWLPQRSVLAHKNVKVFITHGGMGSIVEALYHGVPMVCIPFFGDQEKNCGDVVRYGVGKLINIDDLTADLLLRILNEVLSNPQYAENTELRSRLLKEQPMKPMDNAAFWVEHVVRHKGAKHLRARATQLAWYQLSLLDVAAFLSAVSLASIYGLYYIIKVTLRKIFRRSSNKIKLH